MCNRALLLFGKFTSPCKLPCKRNDISKRSDLRFETGLSSLRVSCKRAFINTAISFICSRLFLIYCILSFVSTTFFTQTQPLFVFLQSGAGSNNKRDKTKSCKHQRQEGSKIAKYIGPFFFNDKGLKLSLPN